jgi:hypothetical protein
MAKKEKTWRNIGTHGLRGDKPGAKTCEPGSKIRTQDWSDWASVKEFYLGLGVIEEI